MDYRIEQLRYLLREDPSSRIFFQLGELLRREGEASEAVEVLKSGLERHPRYVAAWVSLGRSHRDLGALAEAEKAFATALEIDRENPVAARLLGETAAERGDWLAAVKALKLTRALAGGDAELDAEIARVEERLDEDGRLERIEARPRHVEPPARCLEVVSFSGDDPFSSSSEETSADFVASDVFDLADDSPGGVTDEIPDDHGVPSEPDEIAVMGGEELPGPDEISPEEPVAEEPSRPADTEVAADAGEEELAEGAVVEAPERGTDSALSVDESSVGAWSSTVSASGVTGEEAWREPTDEFRLRDDEALVGGPWSEPTPVVQTPLAVDDTPVTEEPEIGDEVAPEPLSADGGAVVPEMADAAEVEPEEAVAAAAEDEFLPGEEPGFDAVEATRPIAVDGRSVEMDSTLSEDARDDGEPSGETADDEGSRDGVALRGARHELESGVPLPTMTLARLAYQQDDRPLAMATLESLLERNPGNAEAVAMLAELRAHEESAAAEKLRAAQAATKIAALQGWLDAVRLAAERRVQ